MSSFTTDEAQQKMLPEMLPLLQRRYRLLQTVQFMQPVGRRVLAETVKMTEREARKETDLLREQGLIVANKTGMICTEDGNSTLDILRSVVYEWSGLSQLEHQLQQYLGIQQIIIVPGHCEEDETAQNLLGKEAAQHFKKVVNNDAIVAVTGGGSVASLAQFLQPSEDIKDCTFIAARGGIGHEMQMQANTLTAKFANKIGANYRTLYLPEHLSEQAYEAMLKEPMISEMVDYYDRADIVIHGIGSAEEMAVRRNSTSEDLQILKEKGAVSEAFGYYFNDKGQIVHQIRTIGIQFEQVEKCNTILAVAAGEQKVNAILSYFKVAPKQTVLVTDEAAAKAIAQRLL
ncbi:MAG: sugar-binding domain-containing protein [Lysinibacillus sp.]